MALFLIRRLRERQRRAAVSVANQPLYKTMRALAAVMVPAHGFVVGAAGLAATGRNNINSFKTQASTFIWQVIRGSLVAAAIAAGLLIYTAFVAKWKARGYPTIPISALIAAEQATSGTGQMRQSIPLGGGSATRPASSGPSRQTSILDMDEYLG